MNIKCVELLVFLALCSIAVPLPINSNLDDLIFSIKKLIDYYEGAYQDMNFDGIFGLRVLEGGLKLQISNYAKGDVEISEKNLAIIKELSDKAAKLSILAIDVLRNAKDKSYERLFPLIRAEWKGFSDYKELDFNLLWPENLPEFDVEEEESDDCFSQIFGTAGYAHCSLSDKCLNILVRKGGKEYVITHQIITIFLIKQESCTGIERQLLERGINLEKYMQELCSNNFHEVATSVRILQGKIPLEYRDLFMEQIFVCPSYGYTQFLHTYFLKKIMSWQHSDGCFGYSESAVSAKNITALKNMRKLLEEKELANGCMSHESAVACGALVVFLRYLIEHPQSSDSSFNNLLEHSLTTNVKPLTITEEQPAPKLIGQDYEEKKESNNDQDYHQYMDIDDPRRSDIRQELQRDASLRQRSSYKNRSDSIHLFIFLLAIIPSLILLFRFIRSRRIVILYPARFW